MTMKEKIMGLFGKALDEAMPEEAPPVTDQEPGDVAAMLAAIMERLDKLEASAKPADEAAPAEEVPPAEDACKADEGDHAPEEMPALEARLATIEKALAKLAGLEEAEGEPAAVSMDAETVARAEILAPGLAKTADIKAKSLTAAYATADGKAVIDTLLSGKSFDAADKDMLFVAASEMMKGHRRDHLAQSRVSLDALSIKTGDMTPERINQLNAERYGNNK